MGEHVGNDRAHDIGLAVDDDDVLTRHEVKKSGSETWLTKVVRRRKQRDAVGNRAADADIDAARWNRRDRRAVLSKIGADHRHLA